MTLALKPWSAADLPVLERANTPEMTRFIGGPETEAQVADRHERYLRLNQSGEAEMYRIDVDDEPGDRVDDGNRVGAGVYRRPGRLRDVRERRRELDEQRARRHPPPRNRMRVPPS